MSAPPSNISTPSNMNAPPKPQRASSASSSGATGQEGESLATPLASLDLAPQEGQLLLRIEKGVRVFFIPQEGEVTCPEEETFLEVVTFKSPPAGAAEGFLQVGEFIYPLIKGQSPVLQSFYGSYIFPDFKDSEIKQFVGVSLPHDAPGESHQLLVDLLVQFAHLTRQETDGVDGVKTEKTLQFFNATTKATTDFVLWGSAKICEVITQKSDDIQESTPRAGEDSSVPVKEVDPRLQELGEKAVTVSNVTVRVTNAAVAQVNRVTAWLAKSLAPTVQDTAAKVVSGVTGKPQDPKTLMTGDTGALVLEAVKSSSALCKAMEGAAYLLARSLGDNTVKVVTHMYGPKAGLLASTATSALLQTAATGHNVSKLTPSTLARQTAKDVVKVLDKKAM